MTPDAPTTPDDGVRTPGTRDGSTRPDARVLNPGIAFAIAIGGTSSNTGKTTLAEHMIRRLVDVGLRVMALKVTRTHVDTCPRENDACGVCDDLTRAYEIVRDRERLDLPRKDTGRYFAAGAHDVRWLLVQPTEVAAGLHAAITEVPVGWVLVAEGNSVIEGIGTDAVLMAVSDREVKPSARRVAGDSQAFVDVFDTGLDQLVIGELTVSCSAVDDALAPVVRAALDRV